MCVRKEESIAWHKPSTMPKPDRRIGTMQILLGSETTVAYSKPRGVLSCNCVREEAHLV